MTVYDTRAPANQAAHPKRMWHMLSLYSLSSDC